jgi:hypothetical protein
VDKNIQSIKKPHTDSFQTHANVRHISNKETLRPPDGEHVFLILSAK